MVPERFRCLDREDLDEATLRTWGKREMDPIRTEDFPRYLITVELMSEAFNPDDPGINGSELDLGSFHQTLPVSVQALLPGILADVDWDRHAMDWGY